MAARVQGAFGVNPSQHDQSIAELHVSLAEHGAIDAGRPADQLAGRVHGTELLDAVRHDERPRADRDALAWDRLRRLEMSGTYGVIAFTMCTVVPSENCRRRSWRPATGAGPSARAVVGRNRERPMRSAAGRGDGLAAHSVARHPVCDRAR